MGRPKLPTGQRLSVMAVAMLRPAEKAALVKRARELERSPSSVVRSALLQYLRPATAATGKLRREGADG